MTDLEAKWERRLQRERAARKEAEKLLEDKSEELWELNQSLASRVAERTRELEEALAQAEQANRAKDVFLSTMSHEVRTPLNAILGFAQLLEMRRESLGELAGFVDNIQVAGKSLLNLVNSILDITKLESGRQDVELQRFDANSLVSSVLTQSQVLAQQKGIELVTEQSGVAELYGDVQLLTQAVLNLVVNAIKFSPEQGVVTLTLAAAGDQVAIAVRDNGIGIARDKLDELFKPFSQVHDRSQLSVGGTGLGLAIVKSIVEGLHGGRIEVTSELGSGSEFRLFLPTSPSQVS